MVAGGSEAFQGVPTLALQLLLSGVLAEASYRWVERPLAHGWAGSGRR
jgi:peptidoglycan/LPS O-acetylase OafA/YrhL